MRLLEYGSRIEDRGRHARPVRHRRPRCGLYVPGGFGGQSVLPAGAHAILLPDRDCSMGFGLFGKLPQKRDFITFGIAGEVLVPLETWLQTAVAASRSELGRGWEEVYLVAPIWRFWIGADVFGANCAGALMPSVDGIGRFFPLLAIYACEHGRYLASALLCTSGKMVLRGRGAAVERARRGCGASVDTLLAGLPAPAAGQPGAQRSPQRFQGGTDLERRAGHRHAELSGRSLRGRLSTGGAGRGAIGGCQERRTRTCHAREEWAARSVFPYSDAAGCGRLHDTAATSGKMTTVSDVRYSLRKFWSEPSPASCGSSTRTAC